MWIVEADTSNNAIAIASVWVAGGAAVAAFIAAGLSALTLWQTSRREERKWRRDALVDILVQFFDGSFTGVGQRVWHARERGEDLSEYRDRSESARILQSEALTRLRLLAHKDVVVAAEKLHEADHKVREAVLDVDHELTEERWAELRRTQREARQTLLTASRGALDLGPAQEISHVLNPIRP